MKWKSTQNYNETVSSFKILYLFLRYHISKEQFECVRSDVPVLLHFTKKVRSIGKIVFTQSMYVQPHDQPGSKMDFLTTNSELVQQAVTKKNGFPRRRYQVLHLHYIVLAENSIQSPRPGFEAKRTRLDNQLPYMQGPTRKSRQQRLASTELDYNILINL